MQLYILGSDIVEGFFTYPLKDKNISHKGTLFSLPGFYMFSLLLVESFCDPFHGSKPKASEASVSAFSPT